MNGVFLHMLYLYVFYLLIICTQQSQSATSSSFGTFKGGGDSVDIDVCGDISNNTYQRTEFSNSYQNPVIVPPISESESNILFWNFYYSLHWHMLVFAVALYEWIVLPVRIAALAEVLHM